MEIGISPMQAVLVMEERVQKKRLAETERGLRLQEGEEVDEDDCFAVEASEFRDTYMEPAIFELLRFLRRH